MIHRPVVAAAGTPVVALPLEPIGQGLAVTAGSAGAPPAVWESRTPIHPQGIGMPSERQGGEECPGAEALDLLEPPLAAPALFPLASQWPPRLGPGPGAVPVSLPGRELRVEVLQGEALR